MLQGHFKKITCLQLSSQFCITASEDFSVRMWEVSKGIQCFIFLDIKVQNAEVISLSVRYDQIEFVSLDLNQNIRIWSIETQQHIKHKYETLSALDYKGGDDYVKMQHFAKHNLFNVMHAVDDV